MPGRCTRTGLTPFAGLEVVRVPALAAGEYLVYDRAGVYLVVGSDFEIFPSREYSEAIRRDALALRVSGDFACAAPIRPSLCRGNRMASAPTPDSVPHRFVA